MNKEQKVKEVAALSERFEKAKALVFAGYRGLRVGEMTELRTKLRNGKSSLKVVKNRLMKRVLKDRGLTILDRHFREPTALATSDADPINPVKVLVEFAKTHNKLILKGGFLDGKELSVSDIEVLAKLPGREVLLAKALGSMQAPATNLALVLSAMPRKLVYAINAIREKKQ